MLLRRGKPSGVSLAGAASADDEAALMQAARCDPSQFAPVYRHYVPLLYSYCLRRAGTPQDAEDLTSQIVTRALKGLRTYRSGSVAAWLFRIAHNTLVDHYRQREPDCAELEGRAGHLTDPQRSLDDQVIGQERAARLRSVIAQLDESDRELLALKFDAGLSSQEMGAVLGKGPEAVRVQLCRVLKHLRAQCPEDVW